MLLQPQRQQHLLHLATQRLAAVEEQVLRHLLGDRRPALHQPSGPQVDHRGPQHADPVDAPMRPEPPVLDRHRGRRQRGRQVRQVDLLPHHVAVAREHVPVAVRQLQRRPPHRAECGLRPRQIPGADQHHHTRRQRPPDRQQHRRHRQPPHHPSPAGRGRVRRVHPSRPLDRRRFAGKMLLPPRLGQPVHQPTGSTARRRWPGWRSRRPGTRAAPPPGCPPPPR